MLRDHMIIFSLKVLEPNPSNRIVNFSCTYDEKVLKKYLLLTLSTTQYIERTIHCCKL